MGKATQDLQKEHDAILHVFKIMGALMETEEKEDTAKLQYGGEYVHFLKTFADKCHHGKEEDYFFEALMNNGMPEKDGLIADLLQEHSLGRQHIQAMDAALRAGDLNAFTTTAASYRSLMEHHIEKENGILFVNADQMLDAAEQDELFEQFEAYEESVIGHGVHEDLHAMIHRWSTELEAASSNGNDPTAF